MKNFFEHQDIARKNTARLIALFCLALLVTVICFYFAIFVTTTGFETFFHEQLSTEEAVELDFWALWWDLKTFMLSLTVSLAVIGGGAAWKIRELAQGGGSLVCEQLGGRFIDLRTDDFHEKRLINIVQEMAIASGVSVPLLYVLDRERGINAFAAGFNSNSAAIAVSRGALELLNRQELQGVIAHEFSHILNGDMRMNIRMMGILHGILMIGMAGVWLFRIGAGGGRSRSNNGGGAVPFILLGLCMMLIGYGGRFIGNIIKSAISRQREFLADASAVQFTRNPAGLSGALQKIGGWAEGSHIQSPNAEQVSHMFFGEGVEFSFFTRWLFATHPPLKTRIRRIDPKFSGAFPMVERQRRPAAELDAQPQTQSRQEPVAGRERWRSKKGALENVAQTVLAGELLGGARRSARKTAQSGYLIEGLTPESALDHTGRLTQEGVDHARDMISAIPAQLRELARDSFGATSVAFAMLLDHDDVNARAAQLELLGEELTPQLAEETRTAAELLKSVAPALKLPLLELLVPALRTLSQKHYERFIAILDKLIWADGEVSLFEYSLKTLLKHRLSVTHGNKTRHTAQFMSLTPLRRDIVVFLSFLADAGSPNPEQVSAAYAEAIKSLSGENTKVAQNMPILARHQLSFERLSIALERLSKSTNKIKRRVVRATAACVLADQLVTVEEAQLLRVMCEVLDVPLPPFLPKLGAQPADSTPGERGASELQLSAS